MYWCIMIDDCTGRRMTGLMESLRTSKETIEELHSENERLNRASYKLQKSKVVGAG